MIERTAKLRGITPGITTRTYRQLLLTKKLELQLALGISFHRLKQSTEETGADPEQLLQEESVGVGLNRVYYWQLRQVEEALSRLDAGEYGVCQACGSSVPSKRLEAVPWARYCLDCQERVSPYQAPQEIAVEGRI